MNLEARDSKTEDRVYRTRQIWGAFLYGQTRVVIFSSQTKGPLCLKIVFKKAAAEESTATIKK